VGARLRIASEKKKKGAWGLVGCGGGGRGWSVRAGGSMGRNSGC